VAQLKGEILARDETICTRTQQIVDDKHRADELEKELNEKIVALDEVAKGLNIELKVSEGGLSDATSTIAALQLDLQTSTSNSVKQKEVMGKMIKGLR
jgi:hypothetical protein